MVELNREDVIRRWKAAREQKRLTTQRMAKRLEEIYEKKHGVKPEYIEIW